jgi:predicted component of type VI protein secretion system
MKTTVEVPDELYRKAKSMAALRGRKLKDLIEEGLRLIVEAPRKSSREQSLAQRMKRARGVVDSGIPDLASNPRNLAGFGGDAGDR